jgi:hypothetical protein
MEESIMKNRFIAALALAFAMLSLTASAQDLVVSGSVVGVSPEAGTLILTNGPNVKFTLTGLHQARIRAVDGRVVALGGLRPGMRVSVAYLPQGQQWVVSRVLVASEAQPEVVPIITDRRYKSLFDGDITTNPGSKAAIDGDITTKPARSANRDGDITTKSDV